MPGLYDRGDVVHLAATFLGTSGAVGDPSTIYLLLVDPQGNRATHKYGLTPSQIYRSGVGAYYLDLDVEVTGGLPGQWGYRWEGTGGVQSAAETYFAVAPTFKL